MHTFFHVQLHHNMKAYQGIRNFKDDHLNGLECLRNVFLSSESFHESQADLFNTEEDLDAAMKVVDRMVSSKYSKFPRSRPEERSWGNGPEPLGNSSENMYERFPTSNLKAWSLCPWNSSPR
uniref:Ubiquitinyl hydrolase 1 n=1 Tax=Steinernema glaseri TaxID=37863 RepID=A0A1I7ZU21_9BILA